jgi:hypothetical protein
MSPTQSQLLSSLGFNTTTQARVNAVSVAKKRQRRRKPRQSIVEATGFGRSCWIGRRRRRVRVSPPRQSHHQKSTKEEKTPSAVTTETASYVHCCCLTTSTFFSGSSRLRSSKSLCQSSGENQMFGLQWLSLSGFGWRRTVVHVRPSCRRPIGVGVSPHSCQRRDDTRPWISTAAVVLVVVPSAPSPQLAFAVQSVARRRRLM